MNRTSLAVLLVLLLATVHAVAAAELAIDPGTIEKTVKRLLAEHGEDHAERAALGVRQVSRRWWVEDGDAQSFSDFCESNFIVDPQELDAAFGRLSRLMEQIDGHLHEVRREIMTPLELDTGPVGKLDQLFSGVDLATHVDEDLYTAKVAFLALLNFPVHTLDDRLQHGDEWDRATWARSRMMDRFAERVPSEIAQQISRAFTEADQYVASYNIRMDRLITPQGLRMFPEGLRLITHWGLRDELKSQYAEEHGLDRQRAILEVMQHIVHQSIPQVAIDNGDIEWCPQNNELRTLDGKGVAPKSDREPDTRYARLLSIFHAVRQADPYSPTAPTYIDRRFKLGRQIREKQVEQLLVSVLSSDEFKRTGKLIRRRLGRPLEPFDIWYNGFAAGGSTGEAELDRIVAERYPNVAAFQQDLPQLLIGLGFAEDKAGWLSQHVVVDPSRGAGHAMGAVRREDKAHLRTRVGQDGMDYKGYNIAVHEFGHNVEQVFSLNGIDHWWLSGVPNTAFTEALAFVFQNRDLELLGLPTPGAESGHLEALETLWSTAEIGGVALLDMRVWRWMYENPEATPAELRQATLEMARQIWNEYYAPVFGSKDEVLLAIYSHMVVYGLYLPDYPLGHMIAFQVAAKLREGDFGQEFERMCRQGQLTPDAWMRGAVGQALSSKPLLVKARAALDALKGPGALN